MFQRETPYQENLRIAESAEWIPTPRMEVPMSAALEFPEVYRQVRNRKHTKRALNRIGSTLIGIGVLIVVLFSGTEDWNALVLVALASVGMILAGVTTLAWSKRKFGS